jgi:anhydro-N-acetylmuramic acid kinase
MYHRQINRNIQKLYLIAAKKKRTIIGLMSGTSLDGLDVALCEFSGSGLQTKVAVNKFATVPYTKKTKDKILKVFARHQVNFEELCLLNPYIGVLHGEMVLNCLRRWRFPASKVDIIASHGQTVFHSPSFLHPKEKINGALQISVIICQVYLIYIYNIAKCCKNDLNLKLNSRL